MTDYFLAATCNTPEVDFRFSQHRLSLKGECFPENAALFFGDLLERTASYLAGLHNTDVNLHIRLAYFNSASTNLLYKWIAEFNRACDNGNFVMLHWHHDAEDDTLQDFGMDIKDEFGALRVVLHALAAS
jgi:DNA modification methylase